MQYAVARYVVRRNTNRLGFTEAYVKNFEGPLVVYQTLEEASAARCGLAGQCCVVGGEALSVEYGTVSEGHLGSSSGYRIMFDSPIIMGVTEVYK